MRTLFEIKRPPSDYNGASRFLKTVERKSVVGKNEIIVIAKPKKNVQTFYISSQKKRKCKVLIFDCYGSMVRLFFEGYVFGGINKILGNVSDLPPSQYTFVVSIDGVIFNIITTIN